MLLDGKARRPVEGINGGDVKLPFSCKSELFLRTFAATIYHDQCSGQALLMQYLTHSTSSSRFPLNFKPLHFSHRFSWSTVYSSASLSNLEPGMPSSSVRTVLDWSELLTIHVFFPRTLTEFDFVCLSHDRGQNVVTSLVHSTIKADLVLKVYASLMRDELPSRANNSANDQDSVQEFLKWSEQISVEFVTKKPSFPCWRLIRLHHRFLCDVSSGNLKKWQRVGEPSGP